MNAQTAEQNSKINLKLDFCSFEAAKYAVMNWHYSKAMPAGKLVKIGVWENEKFVGAVIFGRGANNNMCKYLKVEQTDICELVRVALTKHESPTTRIVAIALKLLKKTNPGIKTVFSYADWTNQHHEGIIYKAGNWKRHGLRKSSGGHVIYKGKLYHNRSISSRFGSRANIPEELKKQLEKPPVQEKYLFTYDL